MRKQQPLASKNQYSKVVVIPAQRKDSKRNSILTKKQSLPKTPTLLNSQGPVGSESKKSEAFNRKQINKSKQLYRNFSSVQTGSAKQQPLKHHNQSIQSTVSKNGAERRKSSNSRVGVMDLIKSAERSISNEGVGTRAQNSIYCNMESNFSAIKHEELYNKD